MSLLLGAVKKDGIVLTSDSRESDVHSTKEVGSVKKIVKTDNCIIGFVGTCSFYTPSGLISVRDCMEEAASHAGKENIPFDIVICIANILRKYDIINNMHPRDRMDLCIGCRVPSSSARYAMECYTFTDKSIVFNAEQNPHAMRAAGIIGDIPIEKIIREADISRLSLEGISVLQKKILSETIEFLDNYVKNGLLGYSPIGGEVVSEIFV